ncbi:MAG TPA: hypothetical protein VI893_09865, partial [Thermoplasmata archaeon]|nr:hypothetical protein [Thermoplasmata archaeon]
RRDASTGTELGRLEEFRTDPGHPDTDRDGLADRVARPDLLFALGEDDGITRPFHIRNDEGTTQCRDPQGNLLPTFFSTEFRKLSSSPTSSDTDGDGISDLSEMNALHTPSESDPRNLDSDRSGLPDAEELSLGRKPADGCDDPVDSDKDGIEDILDNQLFLASNCNNIADVDGDSLANGAFDPDSDGDGFNDGEEVAYWREKLNDPAGELRDIDAGGPDGFINVCDPDADGDGLFEDEEIRGWRTDIVTSIDQLIMIVNAICEEVPPTNSGDEPTKCANPPQSIDSLLSHSIVTSDPGDPDSDRDGFDDGNEFVSRSNPRGVDSDQDGIRDDEDFDPVVVDLEQPSMLLHGLHKSSGRSPSGAQGIEIDSYSATLEVEDNAGLLGISWELCVGLGARWIEGSCNGGSVRGIRSTPIDPKARSAGDYFSFIVEKGSLSDIFETAILRISSFDKHGNVGRLTVEKSSDIGVVTNAIFTALKLDLADKEGVSGAAKGGALEGLFRGFATQIRDLLSIILDPGAFLDGAQAIIDNELGFLIIQMAQGIIADVVAQEQAANIFVGISGFEEAFRIAFFAGFVLGFVIFEIIADIVGWSAASAAKTIKTGAKATRASRAVDAKLKVGKKEFSDDVQAFVAKLADSGGPFHQQYQRLIRGAYSIPDNLIRNLFEPQKICTICKIPTKLRNQVVYDKLIKELGWNDELVNKMDEVIERAENNMASAHEKTARIKRLLDIDPADVDAIRRNLRESFENRIPAEARRDIRMIDTTHKYKDLPGIERQWPSLKLGSRSATYEITSADELAKRFGQNVEEFQPRVGGGVRDSKVGGRVYDSKDFESPAEWQASFPSERSLRDELRRWEIIRDNVELDSGRGSFGGYVFASEPPLLFGIDIRAFLSAKGIETHIVAP